MAFCDLIIGCRWINRKGIVCYMKSTVSFILCVVLLVTVCLPAELIALADQDVPNDTPTENHTITDGQATNGEIYYFDYIKDFQSSKVDELVLFEGEKRHTKETDLMFTLNFPENAWYNLTIEYIAERDDNGEIGFGLKIDGKYPFYEARRFTIPRLYKDDGAVRKDGIGNEFTPIQSEEYIKQTVKLANYSSFDTDATKFYFSKGTHSLIFTEFSSAVKFYKISLTEIEETKNYGEILEKYKDNKEVSQRIDDYINRNYKYVMPINIFRMTSTIELSDLRNDLKKFIIPESYYYLDNFTELEKYIEKNIKFTDEVIENSFKVVKDEDICRKKY